MFIDEHEYYYFCFNISTWIFSFPHAILPSNATRSVSTPTSVSAKKNYYLLPWMELQMLKSWSWYLLTFSNKINQKKNEKFELVWKVNKVWPKFMGNLEWLQLYITFQKLIHTQFFFADVIKKKQMQNVSVVANGSTNEQTDERRKIGIKI